MRNEISFSDAQIEDLFDRAFSIGVCADKNLDFSRDTIDQFIASLDSFHNWSGLDHDETDGFKTLKVESVQVAKGRPRVSLYVIDFGSVRAIYQG